MTLLSWEKLLESRTCVAECEGHRASRGSSAGTETGQPQRGSESRQAARPPRGQKNKKIFLRTGKGQKLLEAEKLLKVSAQRSGLEGYLLLEDNRGQYTWEEG